MTNTIRGIDSWCYECPEVTLVPEEDFVLPGKLTITWNPHHAGSGAQPHCQGMWSITDAAGNDWTFLLMAANSVAMRLTMTLDSLEVEEAHAGRLLSENRRAFRAAVGLEVETAS